VRFYYNQVIFKLKHVGFSRAKFKKKKAETLVFAPKKRFLPPTNVT
jgi:hypothetical protein